MDFDLEWTLPDAQYVCRKEVLAVTRDENDLKTREELTKKGLMFSKSLTVINEKCRPELTKYRNSLKDYMSEKEKNDALDALYSKYKKEMEKGFFSRLFGL